MTSQRGGERPSFAGNTNSSPKEKSVSPQQGHFRGGSMYGKNSPRVNQLNRDVEKFSLDSAQDGVWEVVAKKSKNRAGSGAANPWGPRSSTSKVWSHPDVVPKLGMACNSGAREAPGGTSQTQTTNSKRLDGRENARPQSSNRGWENTYVAPQPGIPPPLHDGWQWATRASSSQSKASEDDQSKDQSISQLLPKGFARGEDTGPDLGGPIHPGDVDKNNNDIDDDICDTDDDILADDFDSDEIDFDSDASQKSHETRKKSKWFKTFFVLLDSLTNEQVNEPERQWHCPACKGGPGGIEWYIGLQPLLTHAKMKGAKRVKLHREFAELLEEELYSRGNSVIPDAEAFGKWEGLHVPVKDHDIIWPPMVVIMNTQLEQNENEKWVGMGNQVLLDYFASYRAVKARHSYGPQGHRGMSVLVFEGNARGYFEAEHLHKHFAEQGTDRDAWDRRQVLFFPGGKRQLYGYMAIKEDMDIFNQHSEGKSKTKFEMRSYLEMVVGPMNEDDQEQIQLKNEVAKEKKAIEKFCGVLNEKLCKIMEENRIVRQRTKMQHEQNKEEMDYQEQFFKDQIIDFHQTLEKERTYESRLQDEKVDNKLRGEEIVRFIKSYDKGSGEFEAERGRLITIHEDKNTQMKQRHFEEELELEREFVVELTRLKEQFTLCPSGEDTINSF